MKQKIKLYNVFFPVWMLWLFPVLWLIVLPANFIFDSLVLLAAMACMRLMQKKQVYKAAILHVWLIGFLADVVGALLLFMSMVAADFMPLAVRQTFQSVAEAVVENPFSHVGGFLWVCAGIALSGVIIYWLNRLLSFRKTVLSPAQQKKLSLILALTTAPYLFLLPTSLLY